MVCPSILVETCWIAEGRLGRTWIMNIVRCPSLCRIQSTDETSVVPVRAGSNQRTGRPLSQLPFAHCQLFTKTLKDHFSKWHSSRGENPTTPQTQAPSNLSNLSNPFLNNIPVIVIMNNTCFATKIMSVFRSTLNLSGFFDVLEEIKKKMLNLRYNLWTTYEQSFQNWSIAWLLELVCGNMDIGNISRSKGGTSQLF